MMTAADQLETWGISVQPSGENVVFTTAIPMLTITAAQAQKFAYYLASAYHRAGVARDESLASEDDLRGRVLEALRVEPLSKAQIIAAVNEASFRVSAALRTAELEELLARPPWEPESYMLTGAGFQLLTARKAA